MPKNRGTLPAHLAILGANLIYGLNYVIAKGIMPDYMAPRTIIFFRVTGARYLIPPQVSECLVNLFFHVRYSSFRRPSKVSSFFGRHLAAN